MKLFPLLIAMLACGAAAEAPVTGLSTPGSSDNLPGAAISGALRWQVDFDDASGLQDCSYERNYLGAEDRSAPWLCLDCDQVFQVDVQMSESDRDCYQLIDGDPEATEWLGFSEGVLWRAGALNYRLTDQGQTTRDGQTVSSNSVTEWYDLIGGGGQFQLTISGDLTIESPSASQDPWWGFVPPSVYSCGWTKSTAPIYGGDWRLRVGQIVPDGWFKDACGDTVRLHDLAAGNYTLVDISAVDCPPCRDMAAGERAWIQEMRAKGINVEVVTLLAPSLSGTLDKTSKRVLNDWVNTFGLDSPVLGDRGWGVWVVSEADPGFAYPAVVLVGPDLRVIQIDIGWAGWQRYTNVIEGQAR